MAFWMTIRRGSLALAGAAAILVLVAAAAAGPAVAAPRAGTTAARGLPAESPAVIPAGGTSAMQPLTSAAIAAPVTQRQDYIVIPWGAAWAIGAVGAVLLLSVAYSYALAQRRGSGAPPVELTGRRTPEDRRKAA